jgi:hypothetical protein
MKLGLAARLSRPCVATDTASRSCESVFSMATCEYCSGKKRWVRQRANEDERVWCGLAM